MIFNDEKYKSNVHMGFPPWFDTSQHALHIAAAEAKLPSERTEQILKSKTLHFQETPLCSILYLLIKRVLNNRKRFG